MSKKALGMVAIVSILLLAVTLVLFFPFIQSLLELIVKGGDASSCKFSLYKGQGTADCPIGSLFISTDEVQLDGKSFAKNTKEGTQYMAKKALADFLVACFNKGGGYNSNAFSREGYTSDQAVCLKCNKVTIEPKVGNIDDFTGFLRDVKAPSVLDKKYIQILTRDPEHLQAYMEYGMARKLSPSQGTFTFSPSKEYTIFFMGIKKGEIPNILGKIKTYRDSGLLTAYFRNNDGYFVYAVESERLNEVCDRLVN